MKVISTINDPKTKLQSLSILCGLVIGYFFIYIYQNILHIHVEFYDLNTLVQIPIISAIVVPLIYYLLIKADPLQRSPNNGKEIRFFQNEFPSKYLLKRCQRCIENESTCPNYIKLDSYDHIRYWFQDIFHGIIEKKDPQSVRDTFEKGYNCKLVYYLTWILAVFLTTAIVTILGYNIYLLIINGVLNIDVTTLQIIFPVTCAVIIIVIKIMNNPNENNPSGCWQAWREINRMHVSWLRNNEGLLVGLICHNGSGTKTFKER
ncbi:MAG: hypothetical protein ACYDHZ_03345 [Dehalococcoidia bacterium]